MATSVRRSATEIGLAFEKHCQTYLNKQLHMSLRRVGGANDGGIDLRGSWFLPKEAFRTHPSSPASTSSSSSSLIPPAETERWGRARIIAQCKAERKPLGPKVVRELEGVITHLKGAGGKGKEKKAIDTEDTDDDELDPVIAILLSQSGFSANTMVHAARSSTPFMLFHLPGGQPYAELSPGLEDEETSSEDESGGGGGADDAGGDISVESAWWNGMVCGPRGIFGSRVEMKREISLSTSLTGGQNSKVRIWLDGRPLRRAGPSPENA